MKINLDYSKYLLFFLIVVLGFSCTKDDDDKTPSSEIQNSLNINLTYEVDGLSLLFDTIIYTNDAGSQFGVSRMWYYLSQINLIRSDSSLLLVKNYKFVDASMSSSNKIVVSGIPKGNYIGIKFNIGLDSALNITNILPITAENLNMEWPVQMGGGYHFMKFEGHANDGGANYGFAMHLGLNNYLVQCSIWNPIVLVQGETNLTMAMNLNEWFRNPEIYDFNVDGNYSMGVMDAMIKLSNNGVDVFSIQ